MTKKASMDIENTILHKSKETRSLVCFPTGSDLMDIQVGGGVTKGYPVGNFINIIGDTSTGKTFLACEIVAASYYKYKEKLKWVYDDCESGFTFDTKKLYGVEIMPLNKDKRIKSKTVGELYCNIRLFLEALKEDELGIYIVDSLDSLASDEEIERANIRFESFKKNKKFDKKSYGMEKASYLSKEFFKQLAWMAEDTCALVIIISQIRHNVDPMSFEKFTRSGGKAMDFYAHTALWLAKVEDIIRKGIPVGAVTKAKNTKSKTPRPRRSAFVKLLFDYGIDNIQSNIDYLYDFLTPRGKLIKNPSGEWDGENMSRLNLIKYIEENKLEKELKKRTAEKWEAIEESVKSKRTPKYQ